MKPALGIAILLVGTVLFAQAQNAATDPVLRARAQRSSQDLPPVPRGLIDPPHLPPPEMHTHDISKARRKAPPPKARPKASAPAKKPMANSQVKKPATGAKPVAKPTNASVAKKPAATQAKKPNVQARK